MTTMSLGKLELPAIPKSLIVSPAFSDQEFEQLCLNNPDIQLERTKEGEIVVNAPAGFSTGSGNAEISRQLGNWWSSHRHGRTADSSAGYYRPDGSSASPDASYLTAEQTKGLTREMKSHFLYIVPAFVIELRSGSDSVPKGLIKMEEWRQNGAQLGWYLDPKSKCVHVFEGNSTTYTKFEGDMLHGTGPVDGFVLDLNLVWSCYDDE